MRTLNCLISALFLTIFFVSAINAKPTERKVEELTAEFPYIPLETTDSLGRKIDIYLTDLKIVDDRPLILFIQGSGCRSHFFKRNGLSNGLLSLIRRANAEKAQILAVEKPGVELFDSAERSGTADCSENFKREQTGERWLEALSAGLRAAIAQRGVSPRAIMVIGHSEGAGFAARLALQERSVSHVAMLSSAPYSQLQDFFAFAVADEGPFLKAPETKNERLKIVFNAWESVNLEPTSESKLVFGHTHRYWADKFRSFNFTKLENTTAKFFFAYGDRDENASPKAMDTFAIDLLTRERNLTWLRIEGAGHSLSKAGDLSGKLMGDTIKQASQWFLGEPFDRKNVIWPTE